MGFLMPSDQNKDSIGDFYLFVNMLLARGGKVFLTKDNLVFQPTSPLDKALGAKEITISLSGITKANIQGVLVKKLIIIDRDRIYEFIGSDLEDFLRILNKAMGKANVEET